MKSTTILSVTEKEYEKFDRLDKFNKETFSLSFYNKNGEKRKISIKFKETIIIFDKNYNIHLTDVKSGEKQNFETDGSFISIKFKDYITLKKISKTYIYKKDKNEHMYIEIIEDMLFN